MFPSRLTVQSGVSEVSGPRGVAVAVKAGHGNRTAISLGKTIDDCDCSLFYFTVDIAVTPKTFKYNMWLANPIHVLVTFCLKVCGAIIDTVTQFI